MHVSGLKALLRNCRQGSNTAAFICCRDHCSQAAYAYQNSAQDSQGALMACNKAALMACNKAVPHQQCKSSSMSTWRFAVLHRRLLQQRQATHCRKACKSESVQSLQDHSPHNMPPAGAGFPGMKTYPASMLRCWHQPTVMTQQHSLIQAWCMMLN